MLGSLCTKLLLLLSEVFVKRKTIQVFRKAEASGLVVYISFSRFSLRIKVKTRMNQMLEKEERVPSEVFFSREYVPWEIPITNARGPIAKEAEGIEKKSCNPCPIFKTRLVGFPKNWRDPNAQNEEKVSNQFVYLVIYKKLTQKKKKKKGT